MRRNPVNGKLTIIVPGRAARPTDLATRGSGGAPAPCPFCAGNESLTPPEVDALRPSGSAPDSTGWRARVVPNKYPALPGMHEVIVHSPEHDVELEDLGDAALAEVLELWRRRIAAQLAGGAAAATLIVNRGARSRRVARAPARAAVRTPLVPPLLLDELLEFGRFANRYGGCVLCAEMESAGERAVLEGPVRAWVPAASRFPGELWIAPAEHAADFREADVAAPRHRPAARAGRDPESRRPARR